MNTDRFLREFLKIWYTMYILYYMYMVGFWTCLENMRTRVVGGCKMYRCMRIFRKKIAKNFFFWLEYISTSRRDKLIQRMNNETKPTDICKNSLIFLVGFSFQTVSVHQTTQCTLDHRSTTYLKNIISFKILIPNNFHSYTYKRKFSRNCFNQFIPSARIGLTHRHSSEKKTTYHFSRWKINTKKTIFPPPFERKREINRNTWNPSLFSFTLIKR